MSAPGLQSQPLTPQPLRSRESLYKQAFWLFGVMVGLAVGEVLRGIVPHVISAPEGSIRFPRISESIRLFVFLIVTIRFYLGAAAFFDEGFIKETIAKYPHKHFGSDYLIGIAHFIIFFAWAVTLDIHAKLPLKAIPLGLFPGILGFILLYDIVWYAFCREYDSRRLIKRWMIVNTLTFILAGGSYATFLFALLWLGYTPTRATLCAEVAGFLWVVLASLIDLVEITFDKKYFARWFSGFLNMDEDPI